MYELGFHFPRRHEKIKLAEATGLTYRQIGIWVCFKPDYLTLTSTNDYPLRLVL